MLKAGLSQQIVIAKITKSECDFDTSPTTLKTLEAANVPDTVIVAMIEAPSTQTPPAQPIVDEVATPAIVNNCGMSQLIPVFLVEEIPTGGMATYKASFYAKYGDRITLLGPTDEMQSWLKMRAEDGEVGYISANVVTKLERAKTEPVPAQPTVQPETDAKKQQDIQKVNDYLQDCETYYENDYKTRIGLLGTLTLVPMVRLAATARLKQNLDAEFRQCRTQYEVRMNAIQGK